MDKLRAVYADKRVGERFEFGRWPLGLFRRLRCASGSETCFLELYIHLLLRAVIIKGADGYG